MMPDQSTASSTQKARFLPNNALWLGPLLALSGAISYFVVFSRYPVLRDFPWLNLPWVLLGCGLTVWGFFNAARKRVSLVKTLTHVASLCVSFAIAVLFAGYVFQISYLLPPAPTLSAEFRLPANLTFKDQTGTDVHFSNFQGQKLVLVFYRGFW